MSGPSQRAMNAASAFIYVDEPGGYDRLDAVERALEAAYPIIREDVIREVVKALEGHVPHGPFWDMQVAADFIERKFGDKR